MTLPGRCGSRYELVEVFVDEGGRHRAVPEGLVAQDGAQERQVRRDSAERELAERSGRLPGRVGEVAPDRTSDHLGDQGVVRALDLQARAAVSVHAHPGAAGCLEGGQRALRGAGRAVRGQLFEVDAGLDREAARLRYVLLEEA